MPRLVFALLSLLIAASSHALAPEPGDVYFVTRLATGVEVHHVDRDSGVTTLVARDGHIADDFTCCLTVSPDGSVWLAQEREEVTPPGRLVRIDPTAFDPGNPAGNQTLVVQNALLNDVDAIAALPAPVVGSVAAVPPWGAGLAAVAIAAVALRLRRGSAAAIPDGRSGC